MNPTGAASPRVTGGSNKVRLLVGLAVLVVAVSGCKPANARGGVSGAPDEVSSPSSAQPPSTVTPVVTTLSTPVVAVVPTQVATPATTTVLAPVAAGPQTTVNGHVTQIYPTGDFVFNDGQVDFVVVMSPTTAIINLRGTQVPLQYIQVTGALQITGVFVGAKFRAVTVLVPTNKDDT